MNLSTCAGCGAAAFDLHSTVPMGYCSECVASGVAAYDVADRLTTSIPTIHAHYCPACAGHSACGGRFPESGVCLLVDNCHACGGSVYSEPVRVSARDWAEYQTRH